MILNHGQGSHHAPTAVCRVPCVLHILRIRRKVNDGQEGQAPLTVDV